MHHMGIWGVGGSEERVLNMCIRACGACVMIRVVTGPGYQSDSDMVGGEFQRAKPRNQTSGFDCTFLLLLPIYPRTSFWALVDANRLLGCPEPQPPAPLAISYNFVCGDQGCLIRLVRRRRASHRNNSRQQQVRMVPVSAAIPR